MGDPSADIRVSLCCSKDPFCCGKNWKFLGCSESGTRLDASVVILQYECTLKRLVDAHAPVRSKVVAVRRRVPWYVEAMREAKCKRRQLERNGRLVAQGESFGASTPCITAGTAWWRSLALSSELTLATSGTEWTVCQKPASQPVQRRVAAVLREFAPVTELEMLKIIKSSPKKPCQQDPMPTQIMMNDVHDLLPVITRIINVSLAFGDVPPA